MAIGILKEILCNSIDINGSENWKTKFIKSQLGSLIQIPEMIYENTFIYLDPPYLITLGSYNDGKRGFNGWTEKDEIRLLNFLSKIDKMGVKFMLSNVLEHKEKKNNLLMNWIKANGFKVIEYKKKARKSRKEVIIVNYDKEDFND